ncbi:MULTISPECIES: DMT family transporter [unclassified Streptomyces]|uniref:DMT family transporter n=1 Tax=unclassified Streptomyces TaxID=2593676 RepID=UPI002E7AAD85|nr:MULTISPECIES: DMT family transporter [unclassified Streptomyces]MEE1762774.1 DMT family transporter [Streptomyces sp. SP18BB07]MEE1830845.1 DMT family transporter [Streptomyces sp. SP17KL33]
MGSTQKNVAAALTAALLWAFAFPAPAAVKPASELLLVTGRYSLFGLCGLYVLCRGRHLLKLMPTRRILFGLYIGFVGYFVFYICVSYSATMGSGFITAVIVGSSPITIAVAGNFAEKRMSWSELIAPVLLILVGLTLLSAVDYLDGGNPGRAHDSLLGILLAVMAMLTWSYFVVRNAQSQRTWQTKPDPKIWAALVAMGAGGASMVLLPFAIATTPEETFSPYPLFKIIAWCVFLGILGSWWGTYIWVKAAQGIPVPLVGPLLATETIFGAILSLPAEQRMPTWTEIGGSLFIVAGIAVYLVFDVRNSRSRGKSPGPDRKPDASDVTAVT